MIPIERIHRIVESRTPLTRVEAGRAILCLVAALLLASPSLAGEAAAPRDSLADPNGSSNADVTKDVYDEITNDAPETEPDAESPPAQEPSATDEVEIEPGVPILVSWDRGIRIAAPDESFKLKIGGRLLADATHISGDSTLESRFDHGWLGGARQARIDVTGTAGSRLYGRFQVDLTGNSESDFSPSDYVQSAFVGLTDLGLLGRAEIGILQEPISMGVLTSRLNIDFLERALPTVLAPGFNAGLLFKNEVLDKRVSWALGVFRGQGGGSGKTSSADIAARVSGVPFANDDDTLFIHVGASYKIEVGGNDARYRARPETHWGDQWTDTGAIRADLRHLVGFELAGVWKPISFQAELLASWIDRSSLPSVNVWGVYAQASWFLTGEHRYYQRRRRVFGRVRLNREFSWSERTWGALELAARYSYLDLNDKDIRGGTLGSTTLGLNWYVISNVRVMLNYTRADFRAKNKGNIFGARFQIDY